MAEKTGVLVVDDSAFMRKVLSQVIEKSDNFYVVDTARDGKNALDQLEKYGQEIQLVTLDIQMPTMDGLTCLEHIMHEHPRRVVMVSSLTTEGARETLDALDLGAIDFIAKPGGAISLDFESVGEELIRVLTNATHCSLPKAGKITHPVPRHVVERKPPRKHDGPRGVKPTHRPAETHRTPKIPLRTAATAPPDHKTLRNPAKGFQRLVAIASSTGGPKALANFLPYLPGDIDAAMLLVQHMPTTFTKLLADRLDKSSQISIKEAEEGDALRPGMCLVAPGGYHMEVTTNETVHLTKDPPIGGLRPCADITFRTVADVFGQRAMGVVLTGMGHDGTEGCRVMREKGSKIIVESKETALIYGMPKSVADHHLHDRAEPINEMADAVVETLKH